MTSKVFGITVGIVADANDPQQMGRLRIICPAYGDTLNTDLEDVPWATYVSPFGGNTDLMPRGVTQDVTQGPVAYGMWSVPVEGAKVAVGCFDGNPQTRFWSGCVHEQFTTNTLPHGRYFKSPNYNTPNSFQGKPAGPYSTYENQINPLAANLQQHFASSNAAYEYSTRGADFSAAAVNSDQVKASPVAQADDINVTVNGTAITQGYAANGMFPGMSSAYRSTVYTWTTPGFHSISMDDRPQNCRVRMRTVGGAQILLDDSNERIYINTAKGQCYVEFDQYGYGNLYFATGFNVHSGGDINFTSDATIRFSGATGIHMTTQGEFRQYAAQDFHTVTDQIYHLYANNNMNMQTNQSFNLLANNSIQINSSTADLNLLASGNIIETGANIHLNGPQAASASVAGEKVAYNPNWIPEHEPWGRSPTKTNHETTPMVDYMSSQNGRINTTGGTITRNQYWRR